MIKRIDSIEQFNGFNQFDIYFIRIMSLIQAYGCSYDFACFYRQTDNDNNITAIISKLDNDYTLCKTDNADENELAEFFNVMGYGSLLTDASFSMNGKYDEGVVMQSIKRVEISSPFGKIDKFPKLMELYNFVDYDNLDFEAWYVDISHRIRHNSAKAYTFNIDDEIISSGIFSSIYKDNAILSAVQTNPTFRRMGYGSYLVSEMLNDIKGIVFLMREKGLNEEFYNRLGFINTGIWRIYK